MADDEKDIQDDVVEENQDDIIDEIDEPEEGQQGSKVEKRIKTLSNKVKLTAQERDNEVKARKKAETERDNLKKDNEFSTSFAENPHFSVAKDYKDEIKKKVSGGYSVDDAIVSVLAKEGKLDAIKVVIKPDNPAGGSSPNLPTTGDQKPLNDMSREEKRAAVMEEMNKGNISLS